VPSDISLAGLHRVIQLMMQWYDYHLYEFEVRGERFQAQEDPEAEGSDAAMASLQSFDFAQGERFTYLYDFGDDWHHEILVEQRRTLASLAWLPWVLEGERAGPPEDCGGTPVSLSFLLLGQILSTPSMRTIAGGQARNTIRSDGTCWPCGMPFCSP
jgi:hypothetical protein